MLRLTPPRALIPVGVLLSLLCLPALAASTKYVDKRYGFLIKLPSRDWSQTPTQPGEETEVAKFKDDRKQTFSTLSIYRFEVEGSGQTTPGGDPPPQPMQMPYPGRQLPKNAKDYLRARLKWRYRQYGQAFEDLPEPKQVKYENRIEGDLYTIELEHPRRRGHFSSMVIGIVDNGYEEYLIVYTGRKKVKKYVKPWTKSIRSFTFPEDDTETSPDQAAEDAAEDLEDRDHTRKRDELELIDTEKRDRIKADLVGDWRFIDTKHYIVIYNCDNGLAKYIAKRVEYMRANAFERVFPPVAPIEEAMVIRVCKEMDEFRHYSSAPPGALGYWASGKDEFVLPDLSQSTKPDDKTIGVVHHEAFHQYVYYALLHHNPPVWFNEGYAEYFYTVNSKRDGKKLTFLKNHPMRFGTVKSALGQDKLFPVKDFVKLTHRQYMQQAPLCYAQGWAFAHWLKNVTKNERYREIPDIFFRELQNGYREQQASGARFQGFGRERGPVVEKAYEKAFEGIDWDKIDEAFKKDLKRNLKR